MTKKQDTNNTQYSITKQQKSCLEIGILNLFGYCFLYLGN